MDKCITKQMIKHIGVYLCNNIPYSDIAIRKNLMNYLAHIAKELDIDFDEFCRLLEEGLSDEKVQN